MVLKIPHATQSHYIKELQINTEILLMKTLTPYLQLGDRLSQIWINKFTFLFLLALLKLAFFYSSIDKELNLAKRYILSHCNTIDAFYNNVKTNTPYYLGIMGNYLIEKTIKETVEATLALLSLLVYASEELMTFVVDLYLGTYACLLVSAIDGTVDVATNTTEKLLGVVNNTVSSFANDLDDGLDDISKVINKILEAVSKVEDFFTDSDSDDGDDATNNIHKVNLTIAALRNVYIPSSINDKLEQLSAKTPDFATVKNTTKKLISEPFQAIRGEIKSLDSSKIIADGEVILYTPQKDESINSTGICSSNIPMIEKMFKDTGKAVKVTTIILIVIFIICALVVMVPEAWKEVKTWKKLKELQKQCSYEFEYFTTEEESEEYETVESLKTKYSNNRNSESRMGKEHYEAMDVIESYQRCFQEWQTKLSDSIVYLFTLNKSCSKVQKRKIRWFTAYLTSERAVFVLSIGLLGIIVSGFQLIILHVLNREIHQAHKPQTNILNTSEIGLLKKDLTLWTKQTNVYINTTETNINQQIFGWVERSTTSVNNTVTTMINDIDNTLADIFNGTLLYHPMTTVVKCVIEDKLYAVEKAMTWIHNKAQLSLPQLNSTEVIDLIKASSNSGNANNNTIIPKGNSIMDAFVDDFNTMLTTILQGFHRTAILELIISCAITGVWVMQVPLAFILLKWRYS